MAMEPGTMLPDVTVTAANGETVALRSFVGRPLVLYVYPRDDTPGCTREAQEFSAALTEFGALDIALLGLSKDSPAKHAKFAAKHALTVPLASDPEGAAIEALGAWVEKSLYGRQYWGIDRSTFLFDADGRLARAWRKVRVAGHVAAVLAAARTLSDAESR